MGVHGTHHVVGGTEVVLLSLSNEIHRYSDAQQHCKYSKERVARRNKSIDPCSFEGQTVRASVVAGGSKIRTAFLS